MNALFTPLTEYFDLPILDWIAAHLHCDFLDAVMPVITALANAGYSGARPIRYLG